MNKYFKSEEPEPEPSPQAASKPRPAERGVVFGTPEDRKKIAISAAVGFAIMALVFLVISKDERPFPAVPMILVAIHGGLLGMLFAQLALVFPDRVIVICTLFGGVMAEVIYFFASGKYQKFDFDRPTFQEIVLLFFWGAFIGFWVGFVNYAKRRKAYQRFQQRYDRTTSE
jgi:hypothetical protein